MRRRLIETGGGVPTPPWVTHLDGSFELTGILPGTYTLDLLPTAVGSWRLKSAIVNGRDVLDFPLEVGADTNVENAVVTLTDGHSELAGALQSASNTPAPEHFVVIFAADRAFWRPASRRVQFTRPGTDGRFVFRDLPPGDYRIAALTDLEATDLFETSFIDTLVPASIPVTIRDGQTTTQDLRLR